MRIFLPCLISLLLACSAGSELFAQYYTQDTVLLREYFDSLTTPNLPQGWVSLAKGTSRNGFRTGVASDFLGQNYPYLYYYFSDQFVGISDDSCGNGCSSADTLVSPMLTAPAGRRLEITFQYYFSHGYDSTVNPVQTETAWLLVKVAGDSVWTKVEQLTGPYDYYDYPTINLSAFAGKSFQIGFAYSDDGGWFGGLGIDQVEVYVPSDVDIWMNGVLRSQTYYRIGSATIGGKFGNYATDTIHSVTLNYRLGNAPVNSSVISVDSGFSGRDVPFSLPITFTAADTGAHLLKIWTSLPNGKPDKHPNNDTAMVNVHILKSSGVRNVLLEEFTGGWCGYSPDAQLYLDNLMDTVHNTIPVCWHRTDSMEIDSEDWLYSNTTPITPGALIDRFCFWENLKLYKGSGRGDWADRVGFRLSVPTPAEAGISYTLDSASRTLNVTVTADFLARLDADIRMNVLVIEDSLRRQPDTDTTHWGYDQLNQMSSAWGDTSYASSPFYNLPKRLKGYLHRYVVRAALANDGSFGDVVNQSTVVMAGERLSQNFSYTLPGDYRLSQLSLVGIVTADSSGDVSIPTQEVLDAASVKLAVAPAGRTEALSGRLPATVYPNPGVGYATVEFSLQNAQEVTVRVLSIDGREVYPGASGWFRPGKHTLPLNLTDIPQGVYLLEVKAGTAASVLKLVVN